MQPVFVVLSEKLILNLSFVTHIDVITDDALVVYVPGKMISLSKLESENLGKFLQEMR